MPPAEERLARAVRHRRWVFTREMALRFGISSATIARRVASGAWIQLHRGVYTFSWVAPSWERDALAAVLAAGNGAVISHLSALSLWGLIESRPRVIEVSSIHRVERRLHGVSLHRMPTLARNDITRRGAHPVTTVARSIADGAARLEPAQREDVVLTAIATWSSTEHRLRDVLDRLPTWPGTGQVRALLRLLDPAEAARLMSWLEVQYLRLFRAAGLPPPEINHKLYDDGGHLIARVDFRWPQWSLIVEVDGLRWHSSPSQKAHDDARQNRLVLTGARVLRYSRRDLDDPERVIEDIRRAAALVVPPLPLRIDSHR